MYFPDNTESPPTHYVQTEDPASPWGFDSTGFTMVFWFWVDDVEDWKSLFAVNDGNAFPQMRCLVHQSAGLFLYPSPGSGGGTAGGDVPRETWIRFMLRCTSAGVADMDWGEGIAGSLTNHQVTQTTMDEFEHIKIGQGNFQPPSTFNKQFQGHIVGWRLWEEYLSEAQCEQELASIRKAYITDNLFASVPLLQGVDPGIIDQGGGQRVFTRPDYVGSDDFLTADLPVGPLVGPRG